ncbi:MAG TPA: PhoH family protein [Bacillota bacterium]|nr:PhoH family protein [Bacillota bacterium]
MEDKTQLNLEIDPKIAPELFGKFDEHLRQIAQVLGVELSSRGNILNIEGNEQDVGKALTVLETLRNQVGQGITLSPHDIQYTLNLVREGKGAEKVWENLSNEVIQVSSRGKRIRPKTIGQKQYVDAIRANNLTFGIGPAGTGKTYLAVAMAVAALQAKEVNRIVLTRPAVEAGEKLGFLPGDLQEKVDPYLRPLNDALFDLLGTDLYQRLVERKVIEIAPLAYMRGRTLDDSFIILDEAQNTSSEQMKMFLTRMGFGSKVVVTGDITQIDLPRGVVSGLAEVINILSDVPGVAMVFLSAQDVVRHELVQHIIRAYDRYHAEKSHQEHRESEPWNPKKTE